MNGRTDHARDSILRPAEEPPLASHLVTPRALYSHHGIYVGNGRVVHYGGLVHGLRRGPVEEVSLAHFAHGRSIRVRHDSPRFDRREVVARARSRLGERSYRLLTNNCEHFCAWALQGESRSRQVECFRAVLAAVWRAVRAAHIVEKGNDPSTRNRQGNDVGTSYRSAIFYTTDEQRRIAEDAIADVDASGLWPGKVVTEIVPAGDFWEAEPQHQDYLLRNPGGYTRHFVRPNWKLPIRRSNATKLA